MRRRRGGDGAQAPDADAPPTGEDVAGSDGSSDARPRRRLRVLLTVVGLVAVLLGAAAGTLVIRGERVLRRVQIDRVTATADGAGAGAAAGIQARPDTRADPAPRTPSSTGDAAPAPVVTFLLVGKDTRAGITPEQRRLLRLNDHRGLLTDTIMLLQVDEGSGRAALLSLPRDLPVPLCDGSRGKINAAYYAGEAGAVGGASCLVQAVTDVTRIEVDHYVGVDLAGFMRAVDALGGVAMHLQQPLRDAKAGLDLPAGCVTLDGASALAFVRARSIDDDRGRMARQQRFIREFASELLSSGTLLDLPKVQGVLSSLEGAVEIDDELSLAELVELARLGRDLTPDRIRSAIAPTDHAVRDGVYYAVLREGEAERLFGDFRDGVLLREPAPAADAPEGGGTSTAPQPAPRPTPAGAALSEREC